MKTTKHMPREGVSGLASADWKEDPSTVLKMIDNQLEPYGLQIEQFETNMDCFAWRIVRRTK